MVQHHCGHDGPHLSSQFLALSVEPHPGADRGVAEQGMQGIRGGAGPVPTAPSQAGHRNDHTWQLSPLPWGQQASKVPTRTDK